MSDQLPWESEVARRARAKVIRAFGSENLAIGWSKERLDQGLADIHRFVIFNSSGVVDRSKRKKIAAAALKLSGEVQGLGGLPIVFTEILDALARGDGLESKISDDKAGRGGDRRSGKRSLKGSVLEMSVRLYREAHQKPGYSENGPLVRFVNAVAALVLGTDHKCDTDVVRKAFKRTKLTAPRKRTLRQFREGSS